MGTIDGGGVEVLIVIRLDPVKPLISFELIPCSISGGRQREINSNV